jgi:tripartite-type tricarboxylate transporter receptor subunit TctC
MKKLVALLFCAVALTSQARENIQIIYGFSAADNAANYGRTMADEANKIQDKYNFIFDVKPGAGQVVAVNYVKNTPNAIFMTSGAFWLRPNFYPNESYNVNDFKSFMTMCSVPFSVASAKYKSWNEVPYNKPMTISTSGLGVVSHIVALEVKKNFRDMTVVPFKSVTDAMLSTLGGQTDFSVGFLGDQEKYTTDANKTKLYILGTTGPKPVGKYPNMSSQGFPVMLSKMNTPYVMMVPTTWDNAKTQEMRQILLKAEQGKSVRAAYALDHCSPFQVPENKLPAWVNEQNALWTGLTKGVTLDK